MCKFDNVRNHGGWDPELWLQKDGIMKKQRQSTDGGPRKGIPRSHHPGKPSQADWIVAWAILGLGVLMWCLTVRGCLKFDG